MFTRSFVTLSFFLFTAGADFGATGAAGAKLKAFARRSAAALSTCWTTCWEINHSKPEWGSPRQKNKLLARIVIYPMCLLAIIISRKLARSGHAQGKSPSLESEMLQIKTKKYGDHMLWFSRYGLVTVSLRSRCGLVTVFRQISILSLLRMYSDNLLSLRSRYGLVTLSLRSRHVS